MQRLAGLGAWALGAIVLAVYLAPHGHRPLLAGAAVVGVALVFGGAFVLRRWPFVLPFAVLACVAARIHVHIGSTEANLLVPMYGVVAAAALLLAWELWQGDTRARELGPVAWPLAAFLGWGGLSMIWTQDVRQGAIELLFFYLPFGLLAVALARLRWSRLIALGLLVEVTAMAVVFAAIGIYQHEARDAVLEPEAARLERLRTLLQGQLGLLGPVHLRALPGRRDPGTARRRAVRARPEMAVRCDGGDRADLGRPVLLVLAVELCGARRRGRARGGLRLGPARASCSRSSRRWSSRSARWPRRASATTSSATTRRARQAVAARSCAAGRTSPSTIRSWASASAGSSTPTPSSLG